MTSDVRFSRITLPILGLLGLLIWMDPTLLTPSSYLGMCVIMGALLCIGVVQGSTVGRIPSLAVMVLTGGAVVSGLGSGYPWNAFEYASVVGCAGVLWIVLGLNTDRRRYRRAIILVLVIAVGALLAGRLWVWLKQLWMFGSNGAGVFVAGPMRNPNIAGRIFGLTAILIWTTGFGESRPCLRGLLIALFMGAVIWTGSRGAILAATLAVSLPLLRRLRGSKWIALSALVAVLLVGLLLVGDLSRTTNLQRVQLVPETVHMAVDHPVLGVGGWNFGLLYPSVSSDHRWQRHPHNLILWLVSSFGVMGVIALGAGCIGFYLRPPEGSYLPLVVFWVTHEMVDTMVWIPGVLMMTVLVGCVIWPDKSRKRSRGWGLAVGLLVLLIGLPLLYASHSFSEGMNRARQGEWEGARAAFPSYGTGFGTAHKAVASWKLGETGRALELIRTARVQNRYDPFYMFAEARILRESGQHKLARSLWKRARQRDPHDILDVEGWTGNSEPPPPCKAEELDLQPSTEPAIHWREPRPDAYLTIVDRSLRKKKWNRALQQLDVLSRFGYQTFRFRLASARRRKFIYERLSDARRRRTWERAIQSMCQSPTPTRGQFHYLFYRRRGIDYAFFR